MSDVNSPEEHESRETLSQQQQTLGWQDTEGTYTPRVLLETPRFLPVILESADLAIATSSQAC